MSKLLGKTFGIHFIEREPDEDVVGFGAVLLGAPAPEVVPLLGMFPMQGFREELPHSFGSVIVAGAAPFIEPPAAWFPYKPIQGYRDPLDPAYYSEGPVILAPPFAPPPAPPASPWFPGWPLGMFMAQQNAQQGSDVPGGGIGAGHGSRILVNTRGGGVDAWAWQNG
jgi:hypothetical protein